MTVMCYPTSAKQYYAVPCTVYRGHILVGPGSVTKLNTTRTWVFLGGPLKILANLEHEREKRTRISASQAWQQIWDVLSGGGQGTGKES